MFKTCEKCGFMYDDMGNECPQCGSKGEMNKINSATSNDDNAVTTFTTKKRKKKKLITLLVIVLAFAILIGSCVVVKTSRCGACGCFIMPWDILCDDCVQYTHDLYSNSANYEANESNETEGNNENDENDSYDVGEFSDDVYEYSNFPPKNVVIYETEGYYFSWYENKNQERIREGISGCTYEELLRYHKAEIGYSHIVRGSGCIGGYVLANGEVLCLNFYQYRWPTK